MVTSNLPFGRWGETFSDDVVAAAMIGRLVHHAEVLTLSGDSSEPDPAENSSEETATSYPPAAQLSTVVCCSVFTRR